MHASYSPHPWSEEDSEEVSLHTRIASRRWNKVVWGRALGSPLAQWALFPGVSGAHVEPSLQLHLVSERQKRYRKQG